MRLNVEKKIVFSSLWLALGLNLATGVACADGFYTIIGPDGHPMIVQKPEQRQSTNQNSTITKDSPDESYNSSKNASKQKNKPAENVQVHHETDLNQNKPIESNIMDSKEQLKKKKESIIIDKNVNSTQKIMTQSNISQQSAPTENKVILSKEIHDPSIPSQKNETIESNNTNFTEIDGVKYVNNEYLEDREFNLDGKKRFYMTPEAGGSHGRYETIERQKGVSASLLERIRSKSEPEEQKAVVLSSTYFRLPKDEVVKNLEQTCFTGKKLNKAKGLSVKNQELGLWPVAPIKEHFAYEVVKLDQQVQNVLLTSYASTSKVQTYYWPLVVFLDQKGCVIEGVSGFKNEESTDNKTQYAALEGILRKPDNATYMFLTPLSSAVDVENKQLTNHGQIKLSIIQ